jgi:hypothetical protein
VGSGAACGAIFLHKGFETLLRQKLGSLANSVLTQKRLGAAMRYFETSVKRTFNPYDPNCETEFEVPMGGVADNSSIGLQEGYLTLTGFENRILALLIL